MPFDVFADISRVPGDLNGIASLAGVATQATVFTGFESGVIPEGWRPRVAPTALAALDDSLEEAGRGRRPLLIVLDSLAVSAEAVQTLTSELHADPLFGFAIPRVLDVDGRLLPLWSSSASIAPFSRRVLSEIPDRYLSTELLAPCMLVRAEAAANFGGLDHGYESLAGALLDFCCRIRRAGFRTIVVNRAGVRLTGSRIRPLGFPPSDDERLEQHFPERDRVYRDFGPAAIANEEQVLATQPPHDERPSLLVDATNVQPFYNGTSQAVMGTADAIHAAGLDWHVDLLASREAIGFHGLTRRFPHWNVVDTTQSRKYTIGFRPSQPWHVSELARLHSSARYNVFLMFDCIAWDVGYQGVENLDGVWNFAAQHADALVFISQYSRDRFETRFRCADDTRRSVCLLSCAPSDYRWPDVDFRSDDGSILVVGNTYDHKDVNRTVSLLVRTFPYVRIKAVGATSAPSRVERFQSGLIPEGDMQQLYASAKVVVVPSFYEGFSLPVVNALAYERTVIARRSALLSEIACALPGVGRLIDFATPEELVERVGLVLHSQPVPSLTTAPDHAAAAPRGWSQVGAELIATFEELIAEGTSDRRRRRQEALSLSLPTFA